MCGRYALYGPQSRYREHFGAADDFEFAPRYNVCPSLRMPVVQQGPDGLRRFLLATWGLIPSWVKDPGKMPHPINAKAETADSKPMFRHAFRKSRVLVPADGFYEWKVEEGRKQPYYICLRDGSPLGFAGLLEHWQGPEGDVATFTLLTTEPNALMATIHDRMPVIIRPEYYGHWLDPGLTDNEDVRAMIGSHEAGAMEAYPVSRKVNSPANDGAELIAPIG